VPLAKLARQTMFMGRYRLAMSEDTPSTPLDTRAAECPNCNARLTVRADGNPLIDACGFESYRFECSQCRAVLAGIIDPADEKLLLAQITD